MSGKSSDILRKSVKHGIGRLTASADALSRKRTTRLTQVAHKSPTRLIPIKKTSVQTAGAAVCALSNYGAGMLQGDSSELSVHVESGAKLGVVTQGAARIYSQKIPRECKANMDVRVEKDGVLVYAPDPCAMFASSSYSQIQEYNIHPESSIALIDWISSGRFKNKERWEFDKLNVRTTLKWLDETEVTAEKSGKELSHNEVDDAPYINIPFLQDSISIDLSSNRKYSNQSEDHDLHAVQDFNCFASLIIFGEHMDPVKDECLSLSDSFAAQYTRIRQRDQRDQNHTKLQPVNVGDFNLSGRVVMGVSKVALPGKPSDAYVFRCAGKTNEDIYRIFHHCLKPLSPSFGFEFYKDRILAQRSEIPTQGQGEDGEKSTETTKDIESSQTPAKTDPFPQLSVDSHTKPLGSSSSFWSVVMLADSGLPTGSFAHSAGLEAAAQLGMIRSEEDVRVFVHAATRSSMQLLAPFLVAGLRIAQDDNRDGHTADTMRARWGKLHQECQAVMVTNQPACSASLDQGKSLVRVASQWLSGAEESSSSSGVGNTTILKHLKSGSPPHIAPALGVIGGLLGLDEIQVCRLFSYCMARDIVSSAVRLSLIGPLASVPLLHNVQESVENGICALYHDIQNHPDDPLLVAASSAPIIEAIHPCHEILQVRLFRS